MVQEVHRQMNSVFQELLLRKTSQDHNPAVSSPFAQEAPQRKGKQDGRRGRGAGLFKAADTLDWESWHLMTWREKERDDTNENRGAVWRALTVAFSTSISRKLRSLTHGPFSEFRSGFFPQGGSKVKRPFIHVLYSRLLLSLQTCSAMYRLWISSDALMCLCRADCGYATLYMY